jgi:hypothetical protein
MFHNRKIMADNNIREVELRLKIEQQVNDLRLNGDIQG